MDLTGDSVDNGTRVSALAKQPLHSLKAFSFLTLHPQQAGWSKLLEGTRPGQPSRTGQRQKDTAGASRFLLLEGMEETKLRMKADLLKVCM